MTEFDVDVVGAKPSQTREGRLARLKRATGTRLRAVLMRPRRIILAGIAGLILTVGTPHVGWDYECRHPIRPGQPCRAVNYCAYYGFQGRRIEFPEYGENCKLVNFMPVDWAQLLGG